MENMVAELREGHIDTNDVPTTEDAACVFSADDMNCNSRRQSHEDRQGSVNYSGLSPQHRPMPLPVKVRSRKADNASERSTVLGYLSVDENMTMRYHGPTSGLYLMTASRVFVSPFWHFSNPGFWPRSKRTTFRTEDEIVSAADAILGGILPAIAVQNKLLESASLIKVDQDLCIICLSNILLIQCLLDLCSPLFPGRAQRDISFPTEQRQARYASTREICIRSA